MVYLLLVNIALAIGFGLYQICFRKLTFFQWNRIYLLSIVVLSLLIPVGLFIDISGLFVTDEVIPQVNFVEVMDMIYVPITVVKTSYSLMDFLVPLYWLGVIIWAVMLMYRFWAIQQAFKSKESHVSFSFFKKVFLGSSVNNEPAIDRHEQVHVEQGHSYDVLLLELVCVFNWFNPVVYLIRKELKFQHECIADELCSENRVAYAELLVANAMRTDLSSLAHEFSNQSFLKKRIMMLFKNKSEEKKRLFYLAGIPVILIVICSTLIFNTSRAKEVVANVESHLTDVSFPKLVTEDIVEEDMSGVISIMQQDTSKKARIVLKAKEREDVVFERTEVTAEPHGGMVAFRRWIGENYQYPQAAIDAGVKGTVQVSFIVEKDGSLTNFKVVKDLGHGTGEAAVDMLQKAPKWSPGIQNGQAVRTAYTLPIRLDLTVMEQQKKAYRAKPEIGENRLQEWLVSAYRSPRVVTSNDLDPYMWATFDVAPDGSLSNFAVRSELEESFKSRFVSLLKNTKWIPAEENGIKQKSRASVGLRLASNRAVLSNSERVEVLPEPKGGMHQFVTTLASKISFPSVLKALKQEGTLVELGFDVLPNGELGNFKIIREAHSGMAKDVMSAVKSYGNWYPGIIDGKKTITSYILPVQYKLTEEAGQVIIAGLKGGNMRVYRGN